MKGVKLFIAFFIFFGFLININATIDLEIYNKKLLNENNNYFKLENDIQSDKEIDENVLNPIYKDYLNLDDKEKNNLKYIPYKYKNNSKKRGLLIGNSISLLENDNKLISLSYPSTYDLRDVGTEHIDYSPTMRDQSSFGLCWAFSFNSILESYLLRKGFDNARTYNFSEIAADIQQKKIFDYDIVEGNYNNNQEYRYTIGLSSLSNALLNWTYFNPVIEGTLGNSLSESILNGKQYTYENIVNAYNIERKKNGSESAYNVVESIMDEIDRKNIIYNDKFEFNVNSKLLNSYYNSLLLTENPNLTASLINEVEQSINVIKEYIISSGAVATVTLVPNSFGSTSNNFIHNNFSLSNSSEYYSDKSGHAVTIIGWDDNYGDINGDGNGDGAWLIQNSWGNDSSVKYFYLSYYDVFSLLETYGISSVEKNNSDNLYRNIYIDEVFNESNKLIRKYNYYIGKNEQKIDYFKIHLASPEKRYISANITDGINSCSSNSVLIGNETVSLSFTDCILKGEVSVDIITKNTSNNNIYDDNDIINAVLYSTNNIEPLENDILLDNQNSDNLLNDEYILNMNSTTIAYKIATDHFKNDHNNYNIDIFDKNNNVLNYDLSMKNGIIYINIYGLNKYKLDDEITIKIYYKGNNILSKMFKIREVNTKLFNDNNYILINDIDDLPLLSGYYYFGYFFLNNDIDLSSIENDFKISANNIYFEGYGHTFKNYTSESGALFKSINNSEIYNVKIENFNITSDGIAGILTDESTSSEYDGLKICNSSISAKESGGVIGKANDRNIIFTLKLENLIINGEDFAGGIFARANSNTYLDDNNDNGSIDGFIKDITINAPKKGFAFGVIDIITYESNDDFSVAIALYKLLVNNTYNSYGEARVREYDGINLSEKSNYDNHILDYKNEFISDSDINNVSTIFNNFENKEKWIIKNGNWPEIMYYIDGLTFDIDTIISNLNLIDDYYLVLNPSKNVNEYLNKLDIDINSYVLEKNEYGNFNNLLSGSDLIKTGDILKLNNGIEQKYLSLIIRGDINSDGVVDILDFKKSSNYLISQNPDSIISNYENKIAADIDGNNQIDILDFKRISNYLLSEGF